MVVRIKEIAVEQAGLQSLLETTWWLQLASAPPWSVQPSSMQCDTCLILSAAAAKHTEPFRLIEADVILSLNALRSVLTAAPIIALAFVSEPSRAANQELHRQGFSAFAGYGMTRTSWDVKNGPGVPSGQKRTTTSMEGAWQYGVAYRFNDYLAFQTAHRAMKGAAKRAGVGFLTAHSDDVMAVAFLPVSLDVELFLGAGYGRSSTRYTAPAGLGPYANATGNGVFFTAAAGANVYLTERLALRLEISGMGPESRTTRRKSDAGRPDSLAVTAGLQYTF